MRECVAVRNASKALTMPPFAPKSSSFKPCFSNPSILYDMLGPSLKRNFQ